MPTFRDAILPAQPHAPIVGVVAAAAFVRKAERQIVRRMLLAEKAHVAALDTTLRAATDRVVAAAAIAPDARHARSTIRSASTALQSQATDIIYRHRIEARKAGTEDLGATPAHDIDDGHRAHVAALGLAALWAARSMRSLTTAEHADLSLPTALSRIPKGMNGAVARTASTETAQAFNAARIDVLTRLDVADTWMVWSAVLDGRVCPECAALDGMSVRVPKSFPSGPPPLHPQCRCVVVPIRAVLPVASRVTSTRIELLH